jgi:hypothetical protein
MQLRERVGDDQVHFDHLLTLARAMIPTLAPDAPSAPA